MHNVFPYVRHGQREYAQTPPLVNICITIDPISHSGCFRAQPGNFPLPYYDRQTFTHQLLMILVLHVLPVEEYCLAVHMLRLLLLSFFGVD